MNKLMKEKVFLESTLKGERSDCAVKAFALVFGVDYEDMHLMFKREGRRNGNGTDTRISNNVLIKLGHPIETKMIRGEKGQKITTGRIGQYLPEGKFLVFTSGHMLALVDGEVLDWTEGRRHRVKYVIKIEDKKVKIPKISPKKSVKKKYVKVFNRPKPGTKGARIWEIADSGLSRKEVIDQARREGFNTAMAGQAYFHWTTDQNS